MNEDTWFAIYATVVIYDGPAIDRRTYHHTLVLPTFYLNAAAQGIVSERHAERIAQDLVDAGRGANTEVNVTAYQVSGPCQ